jgi:hypothetical protein
MKELHKTGPMILRRVVGSLLTPRRIIPILAVAAGLLPASKSMGAEIEINLVTPYPGSGSFASGTTPGGDGAIYTTFDGHPTGTGVFDPFLTYQAKNIEAGYNTSQGGNGQGFLDTKRVDKWNHDLHVGDLAAVTLDGKEGTFYVFELDANETGTGNVNRLLSIDDIRIYTATSDVAGSIQNSPSKFETTPEVTLRYAQNLTFDTTDNWVLIDASRNEGGSTSGSGSSDLRLYVPTELFDGADGKDFLYFYTINGVHDEAADGSQSNAGFEEWKALTGAKSVPDGSSTLLLLGSVLIPLGLLRASRRTSSAA